MFNAKRHSAGVAVPGEALKQIDPEYSQQTKPSRFRSIQAMDHNSERKTLIRLTLPIAVVSSNGVVPQAALYLSTGALGHYGQCVTAKAPAPDEDSEPAFRGQFCSMYVAVPQERVQRLWNFAKENGDIPVSWVDILYGLCVLWLSLDSAEYCEVYLTSAVSCQLEAVPPVAVDDDFFSTRLRLGICVPSTCHHQELSALLSHSRSCSILKIIIIIVITIITMIIKIIIIISSDKQVRYERRTARMPHSSR